MKTFTQVLLNIFLTFIIINIAYSQVKKTPTPQKVAPTLSLNPDDYKYYVLVRRNSLSPSNSNFTLPNQGHSTGSTNLYQSPIIVVDSRTMKELSWWPEGITYLINNYLYVLSSANGATYGKILYKFSPNGKLIYGKTLKWQSPIGEADVQVASDWKHVYTTFNKDAWIGNINLDNASISNMHQVTQSGLMTYIQDSYMKENTLLLSGYMINIVSNEYKKIGNPIQITPEADNFFNTERNPVNNIESAIYDFTNRNKIKDSYNSVEWLDKKHTKILEPIPNAKPNDFNYQVIDLKSYSLTKTGKPVKWKYAGIQERTPDQISPSGRFHFAFGSITTGQKQGQLNSGLFIYDNESLRETSFPIAPLVGSVIYDNIQWSNDSHIICTLTEERSSLNGEAINTSNQGTYVLDINSGATKRVLPYFVNNYYTGFIQMLEADRLIFEANNFLYSCNADGNELSQLTRIPSIYKLEKKFID